MNEDQSALTNFNGQVRLFPLPNLVLFPHVVQPLHIFEPRYRQLMADCLSHDHLMAIVLLQPGWEDDYDGSPPVFSVACLGRVATHQRLPDGRFNLLLRGLCRVRLREELTTDRLYRVARADLVPDCDLPSVKEAVALRRQIADLVLPRFASSGPARDHLSELFTSELPLGPLCDILGFALPLALERKQEMLEETRVGPRAQLLLDSLQPSPESDRRFPPDFSIN